MMDKTKESKSKSDRRAAGEVTGTKQVRDGVKITNVVTKNGTEITYVSRKSKEKN